MDANDQRPRKLVWPLQAMPLARAMSLAYALLILYVSLNPFDFDFQNGIAAEAWIGAPLPRFITILMFQSISWPISHLGFCWSFPHILAGETLLLWE